MMQIVTQILIAFVALQHLLFLWIEMFAWESTGKKVFKGALAPELFEPTKVLAANQGLYNGFLSAGLIWSLIVQDQYWSENISIFFLSCVIIAALYGAYSASGKILLVQGIPAIVAILMVFIF